VTDAGTIEYNPNEGGEEVVYMLLKSAEAQDVPEGGEKGKTIGCI